MIRTSLARCAATVALLWLALIGCSSSTSSSGATSMSATINAQPWQARTIQATNSGGTIVISGFDAPGSTQIQLRIVGVTQPGTVQLGVGVPHSALLSEGQTVYYTAVPGGSGSITLTKLTGAEAEGTFAFVAYTSDGKFSRTVTNGSFKVQFQ